MRLGPKLEYNGIGHCQNGQAKGKGNAKPPDTYIGDPSGQNGATTAAKHEPEGTKEFSHKF